MPKLGNMRTGTLFKNKGYIYEVGEGEVTDENGWDRREVFMVGRAYKSMFVPYRENEVEEHYVIKSLFVKAVTLQVLDTL